MTTRLNTVTDAMWTTILDQQDSIIKDVQQMHGDAKYKHIKTLKCGTEMRTGVLPTSKFNVIEGSRKIKGDFRRAIAWDLRGAEITHDMKKSEREGFLCRHFYFKDPEFEKFCREAYLAKDIKEIVQGNLLYHNVVELPVVTNREMLILRILKQENENTWCVYSGSVDLEIDTLTGKTIRGFTRSLNKYTKVDAETFECQMFIYADPCGSIPASFYNNALEDQMKFLRLIEEFVKVDK